MILNYDCSTMTQEKRLRASKQAAVSVITSGSKQAQEQTARCDGSSRDQLLICLFTVLCCHRSNHLVAQRAAFFRTYEFVLASNFSTSGARSLAISLLQMLPNAQSASPTMYWFLVFRSFLREFVTSISTSWRSSSKIMSPRYPILCIQSHHRLWSTSLVPPLIWSKLLQSYMPGFSRNSVAYLFRKSTCSNQLECFHLAKVCWVTQHVDIH